MNNSISEEIISSKIQLGAMFILFSLLLFFLSFLNYRIDKTGFNKNEYENISDKIRHSYIEYYKPGKYYRRKIVVFLQKRTELILEFTGYSKNMVDERYFVNEKNWGDELIFTVKKSNGYLKQVLGLEANGKVIFTAQTKFRFYNGIAFEKCIAEGILGVLLLFSGISLISNNWKYFKSQS